MLLQYPDIVITDMENTNNVYLVMPFYKNMYDFKETLIKCIMNEKDTNCNPVHAKIISELNLVVTFKKINSLEQFCRPRNHAIPVNKI